MLSLGLSLDIVEVSQVSTLGGFWSFQAASSTLTNLNVTTSTGNITVSWGDDSSPNTVSSGQTVSHTYTL